MANPISNFSRAPTVRFFTEQCPVHGEISGSEVEQFGGSMLVRNCKRCMWEALNMAPRGSDSRSRAIACREDERLNAALIGSGVTPRFAGCTLESFRTEGNLSAAKALSTCKAYVDQFEENHKAGRSLILSGNVGTGKTHLGSGMVQEVIRRHGAGALIVAVAEIVRVARGTMAKAATYTDRDVLNELASLDLLVIDEVGAQKGSDYELGLLHEIIDKRYQLVLPTVLISNLATADLSRYIGDRALDRLRQNGGQAVGFTWSSMRATA